MNPCAVSLRGHGRMYTKNNEKGKKTNENNMVEYKYTKNRGTASATSWNTHI